MTCADLMEIYLLSTNPEHEQVNYAQHKGGVSSSLWEASVGEQSQVAVNQDEEAVVVSFCIHCWVLTQTRGRLANFLSLT